MKGGRYVDWGEVPGVLAVIRDPRSNGGDAALITDQRVLDWLLSPIPSCCGRSMIGWGPRDPDLFHCLLCGRDEEKS